MLNVRELTAVGNRWNLETRPTNDVQNDGYRENDGYSGISFFCSKLRLKKLSTSAGRIDFKLCMVTLQAYIFFPSDLFLPIFFRFIDFRKTAVHLCGFRRLSFQDDEKEACHRVQHAKISRNWSSSSVGRVCACLKNQTFERQWKCAHRP